jgi:plastocyanin
MRRGVGILVGAVLSLVCGPAAATIFAAQVLDQDGKPIANAVISLIPDGKASGPATAAKSEPEKIIDQRNETFVPLVTVLPRMGRVVFANNDKTKHQVYSFSPIKQFEITLAQGEKSPPLVFDKAGVATIGCNIHDHMIAYVVVTDTPWTALTGPDGRAQIADAPPGDYELQLWHPQLLPGSPPASSRVVLAGGSMTYSAKLKVLAPPPMTHMHMGHY